MRKVEIGPIRPPSESQSLLVRVTRGCGWNKCFFCGLYKGMKFSIRSVDEILDDIKTYYEYYGKSGVVFNSCFLQDGDAFYLATKDLIKIIKAIKKYFPSISTITSYARCDSILTKSENELQELYSYGLNHLYRGIESGSDLILKNINKGITSEQIIESGKRSKKAGMILSDFTLLGIGGKSLSEENAKETARVINAVNPNYIRVHHVAIKPKTKLGNDLEKGLFELQSEEEIVREQRIFIESLDDIDSYYVNEHIVNLLLEVRGKLPNDKKKMINIIDKYLFLSKEERLNFAIGRRIGTYYYLSDLMDNNKKKLVDEYILNLLQEDPYTNFDYFCNSCRAKMI